MAGSPGGRRWTDEQTDERAWAPRPGLALALRILARVLPICAGVLAAVAAGSVVGRPSDLGAAVVWWVGLTVVSTLVMAATDRFARRLLPLAALLKLSLAFPDRTPSRMSVALRAGSVKNLEQRVRQAKNGDAEPAEAATTVLALAGSLTTHDRRTRGHSERTRAFTDLLAEELGLSARDRDQLRWASLLHDIGKVKVSRRVLNKPGAPDDAEWEELRRHPAEGAKLVEPLAHWLGPWVDAVGDHHERWDGGGYPRGASGEDISYGGRIVAVADAFETITATRAYKRPLSPAAAREELARCAGSHFDPTIVRAFLSIGVGKLRWVMGPLSWFGALPLVGGLGEVTVRTQLVGGQLAASAASTGVAATGVGTLAVGGMVGASTSSPLPPPPAPVPVIVEVDTPPAPTTTIVLPAAVVPAPAPVAPPTTVAPPPPPPPAPVQIARVAPPPPAPAPAAVAPPPPAAPAPPPPRPERDRDDDEHEHEDDDDDDDDDRDEDKPDKPDKPDDDKPKDEPKPDKPKDD